MNTVVLVGLGNPEQRFQLTRHNLGERLLRLWVKDQDVSAQWQRQEELGVEVVKVSCGDVLVHALFPLTYMNKSGGAVASYLRYGKLTPASLLVLHDDLEVPFGKVKYKPGGGTAGHNGVRSLKMELGTDSFARLRLGIGRPIDAEPIDRFVLQKFTDAEEEVLQKKLPQWSAVVSAQISQMGSLDELTTRVGSEDN